MHKTPGTYLWGTHMISVHYAAYARIDPYRIYGDRFVGVSSMRRISSRVTQDLQDAGLVITESNIATVPQFGRKSANLTIIGIDNVDSPNFQPASAVKVDAPFTSTSDNYRGIPGKVVSGYHGTQEKNPKGQDIDSRTRSFMRDLKNELESASPDYLKPDGNSAIYKIYYMGIFFGENGYSF